MTYPKIRPCPDCGNAGDELGIYAYDNGWRHVECDACYYLGPGEGNITQAIWSHNAVISTHQVPIEGEEL